ncbi:MAG: biotin--[acetyl-CoA-carboxylase] ligase [Chloroflexi bacterium]|nr:biotin--[acetyl-CoA-carboxylase] ligase [Chloroflexota bacterium]
MPRKRTKGTPVVPERTEADLSPEAIRRALTTRVFGRRLHYQETMSSTQDEAHHLAYLGAPEGTLVLAEVQTAGRGRFQRPWITEAGGSLAFSLILKPKLADLPKLNMLACLAVLFSIRRLTGLPSKIKWPNDILLREKKVCGILIDSQMRIDEVDYAIVGIGLNVNLDPAKYPDIPSATSISAELGHPVSRLDLLVNILADLERLYEGIRQREPIHEVWSLFLDTLGRDISVRWGDVTEQGRAETVDEDGNLLLRRADGSLARVIAGEVTLRT